MIFNLVKMIALAAIVSFFAGFGVRAILRRIRVVDHPNERSSHTVATVRGGGLGIVIVVICMLLVHSNGFRWDLLLGIGILVTLAVISFIDDMGSLSWKVRLAGHGACAACFATMVFVQVLGVDREMDVAWIFLIAAFVLPLGYCNAFNFMDGINGIAALQAVVTAIGTVVVAYAARAPMVVPEVGCLCAIAGAALGFIPHNFPRARMFMGDAGSVPLGFGLAACAVVFAARSGWWMLIPFGLLHANFIVDTGITLLRRLRVGQPFHQPHRDHFYQRLVRAGRSHAFVTTTEALLQVVVIALLVQFPAREALGQALIVFVVLSIWCAFFAYAEIMFRRSGRQTNSGTC